MIIFAAVALVLLLALVATQLKLRAVAEALEAERIRNDAQRAQFDRDTRTLRAECEAHTGVAGARAGRWQAIFDAAVRLASARGLEGWQRMAELFAEAGHFRVAALRLHEQKSRSFALEHLVGLGEDVAARLREQKVPEHVLKEWLDERNAFGPGFVLRVHASPNGQQATPGAPLEAQDAWIVPLRDGSGAVRAYVSLAQPSPLRLPDADELAYYDAAQHISQVYMDRQVAESEHARRIGERVAHRQQETVTMEAFNDTLDCVSERLRSGLGHIEGYAQTLLEYGRDLPWGEEKRLAGVILEECQEILEDALLVGDVADLTAPARRAGDAPVEFSNIYAESLQFLMHRAENKGVALSGPPLAGGLFLKQPEGALKRLLILVSNELLAGCGRGNELSLTAWQDKDKVHIHWRASGAGVSAPPEDAPSPRWIAAQAVAHALGGELREDTLGADNRAVSLAIPVGRTEPEAERWAA